MDFTAESGWAQVERYSWKDPGDGPDDAYKSKETFSDYEGYDITLGATYSFSSVQIGLDIGSRLYPQRRRTEVIEASNTVDPEEIKSNQERKFITYRQVLPRIQISKQF